MEIFVIKFFFITIFLDKDPKKNNLYDTRDHLGLPSDLAKGMIQYTKRKGEK